MIDAKNIEMLYGGFKLPDVYLYYWGFDDEITRMRNHNTEISEHHNSDYKELPVSIDFDGIIGDILNNHKSLSGNFRLLRINLYKALKGNRGDKCVLKNLDSVVNSLVADKIQNKCIIDKEATQMSQVFTAEQIRENLGKNNIVLKFE